MFGVVLCDLTFCLVGAACRWFQLLVFVLWLFVVACLWFGFDFGWLVVVCSIRVVV